MQLIFIYGPVGAGKLTIGRELARLTELPLFHNHLVVDAVSAIFPFGSEPFIRLREQMWLDVFREAAAAGQSLIFTFAPECTVQADFPQHAIAAVEQHGGRVCFVRLLCSEAEIERRIEEPSRKPFGKLASVAQYRTLKFAGAFEFPALPEDLILDTGRLSPDEAAAAIRHRLASPG